MRAGPGIRSGVLIGAEQAQAATASCLLWGVFITVPAHVDSSACSSRSKGTALQRKLEVSTSKGATQPPSTRVLGPVSSNSSFQKKRKQKFGFLCEVSQFYDQSGWTWPASFCLCSGHFCSLFMTSCGTRKLLGSVSLMHVAASLVEEIWMAIMGALELWWTALNTSSFMFCGFISPGFCSALVNYSLCSHPPPPLFTRAGNQVGCLACNACWMIVKLGVQGLLYPSNSLSLYLSSCMKWKLLSSNLFNHMESEASLGAQGPRNSPVSLYIWGILQFSFPRPLFTSCESSLLSVCAPCLSGCHFMVTYC